MQLFPSILDGWIPDKYTLRWAFSAANERQVFEAIRDDAHARSEGMEPDSDEYWFLVAEAAIEAILYDLVKKGEKLGMDFTPTDAYKDDGWRPLEK